MASKDAPNEHPKPVSSAIEATLLFIRSVRTSPRLSGDEAVEWSTLEKEFEIRQKTPA